MCTLYIFNILHYWHLDIVSVEVLSYIYKYSSRAYRELGLSFKLATPAMMLEMKLVDIFLEDDM